MQSEQSLHTRYHPQKMKKLTILSPIEPPPLLGSPPEKREVAHIGF